ncbi:hypothetical protein SERLA73DRAFT_47182 [Serpula lacrymans var. lacrymans S7.3]|uniref:Uncharacterized protein n=1 Tax=Serpula lacrymans var. lacrymans (strain S7.3) TaxID=936435 RepID=F8PLM7_SERL3|nr:hypothetical protein SERLA73DRAFT_47182 [Serpula lacrymans var. lacrymans S7.3]
MLKIYFINHMYLSMVLGDMLGSAKLNGMAGHTAIYGDRFVLIKGARSSLEKGAKAQYHPIVLPNNDKYNKECAVYNLDKLPRRTNEHYWSTINKLSMAAIKSLHATITKETGISCMPLTATSPAFVHPYFQLIPFICFLKTLWHLYGICGQYLVYHLTQFILIRARQKCLVNWLL